MTYLDAIKIRMSVLNEQLKTSDVQTLNRRLEELKVELYRCESFTFLWSAECVRATIKTYEDEIIERILLGEEL